MWLSGYWLAGYWTAGYWAGENPSERIKYGENIRLGVGWKMGSDPTSNPTEYAPYTRIVPDATTIVSGVEFGFGGGDFGEGDFGVGENLEAPTFTVETPSMPVYV